MNGPLDVCDFTSRGSCIRVCEWHNLETLVWTIFPSELNRMNVALIFVLFAIEGLQ